MERIIAYCGLTCNDCPTFAATQANDDTERKRIAELWTKEYGHPFKPQDINCDGCLSTGARVFNYCTVCEIRKCGQQRRVKNCAHCNDYKCEKLIRMHEQAPRAKSTLEEIHRKL